jgi:hypothetical protein
MYYVPDGENDDRIIFQGDIFEEFPCFFLPSTDFQILRADGEEGGIYREAELPGGWQEEELLIVRARRHKIILISQSCDIHEEGKRNLYQDEAENYNYQLIHYSPLLPVTPAALKNYSQLRDATKDRRKLTQQNLPGGAFFLPAHEPHFPDSIVYPHWICAITKTKANRFKTFHPKRRLASLASPFRESFAHKLAQIVGRVALPSGPFADTFVDNAPQERPPE